ncbi:MAG: FeoB small GTPase domain-containing protein [Planctomycetota bacterium]|jgi:ferrous iron transport protein B
MSCATKTIAIIGNTGAGKTTLCGHLCKGAPRPRKISGCRVEASEALLADDSKGWHPLSWLREVFRAGAQEIDVEPGPGAQDEMGRASASTPAVLVDTPGSACLFARGEEESATRNLLMAGEGDVLAVVADAKNLRRSLVLFLQVCEFQLPTVLVLNMTDEAQQLGLRYDLERLAGTLGVTIAPVVAIEGQVLEKMTALFEQATVPSIRVSYSKEVEKALEALTGLLQGASIPPRALGLLLLAGDRRAEQMLQAEIDAEAADRAREVVCEVRQASYHPIEVAITNGLYAEAERIAEQVTHRTPPTEGLLRRLDHYAAHPLFGWPIAFSVMLAGYYWVGVLGASMVVDYLNANLFGELLLPACEWLFGNLSWTFARDAILDPDFGLVPTALFLALGLVLPVLFFFYIFFGLLEDSGYLPRLSALMDRSLRHLGLTGKGVLPLTFGFSCITTAILTARILPTKKQQIIASFLLLLGFPCAPLLAVMLVILDPLPWTATATLFGLFFVQVLVAGVLANLILPGGRSDFIQELPPIRIPRLRVILSRAVRQSCRFMKEALPAFMAASFLLFVLDRMGGLTVLERITSPVVNGILGLPEQTVQVFIKTMIRRENGAAELSLVSEHFNALQLLVTLLVMTIFTPCVNATIVLLKERGTRICVALLLIVSCYAIVAGATLNWVCQALGVTFQ